MMYSLGFMASDCKLLKKNQKNKNKLETVLKKNTIYHFYKNGITLGILA